jgi:hypothetical protein
MVLGPELVGGHGAVGTGLDSHFRYLSGLLLGLGLAFAVSIPDILAHRSRFQLLCFMVVLGGLARGFSLLTGPGADTASWLALVMELVVTPCLTLWQNRLSRGS